MEEELSIKMWTGEQWAVFVVPVILGFISGVLSPMKDAGKKLNARPPNYVFGIVWTILFLLYGTAFSFSLEDEANRIMNIVFYSLNLVCLIMWPFVYNRFGQKFGLYLLLVILILTIVCMNISSMYAKICLSPLIGWEIFAMMLNFAIVG